MTEPATITPRGPFSLRAAASFGFGPTEGKRSDLDDGMMRLAFPIDGGQGYAGVTLRQPTADGPVQLEVELRDTHGATDAAQAALAQVARVLSLDHDGDAFMAVGERDPVIGALQRAHPGQRPVLFYSPYEAAAWAVISARRPAAQGATVRDELSRQFGETFRLAGREVLAFPQPEHLLGLADQFPGLNLEKLTRLRGVAGAAAAGDLDAARLQALGPDGAASVVSALRGLGPFYTALVVMRATGFTDAILDVPQERILRRVAGAYGLVEPPPDAPDGKSLLEQYTRIAERWRPFRTWATVLIRLAGERGTVI